MVKAVAIVRLYVLATVMTLVGGGVALYLAGFGHGTYLPLAILFPYAVLLGLLCTVATGALEMVGFDLGMLLVPLATLGGIGMVFLQFFIYAAFLVRSKDDADYKTRKARIFKMHAILAVTAAVAAGIMAMVSL